MRPFRGRPCAVFLAALAAAACSRDPRAAFPVGLLGPVSPRIAAEARRLGLEVSAQAPSGAAAVSAAVAVKGGTGEVAADWTSLRFLTARAVVRGSAGVFLRLPLTPAGHDLLDYAEEWQAATRVTRELLAMRPVIEGATPAPVPFAVPAGVERRAWTFRGRRYVLLVNSSSGLAPLEESDLMPWRALFAVRSDARQVLVPCGRDVCLPPRGVLWLEGRLLPNILP